MRRLLKKLISMVIGTDGMSCIGRVWNSPHRITNAAYAYDIRRFEKYAGPFVDTKGALLARVIATYHVIEKGLTMPQRRKAFGKDMIKELIRLVSNFEARFGKDNDQVIHAVGTIKAYWEIHKDVVEKDKGEAFVFWHTIELFLKQHAGCPVAVQPHTTRQDFYSRKNMSFPEFAKSRHSVRNYATTQKVPMSKIKEAVEIARLTPSACNRQYCRVFCVTDKEIIAQLLALQSGNRGWGHLADKLLIVVANLEGALSVDERNDIFTNGGMFLMNLSYALHYNEVAHCILNWSKSSETDAKIRSLLSLSPSESVIALMTCGEAPAEFDLACSPRKSIDDLLVIE